MKRFACLALAMLMLTALFTGCGAKETAEENSSGDYLKDKVSVGISADGGSFSPATNTSWGNVEFCLFQSLAIMDNEGGLRLQMLKSFEEVDETHYACELWDCIYDSAGNNFTANDVAFCIDQFIATGNGGGLAHFDHVEVTGTYTFNWVLTEPFSVGEMAKSFSNVSLFTEAGYLSTGADEMVTQPIGTGPYMLKEYVPGSSVTLVANENFWMNNIEDEEWLSENYYLVDEQNVREIEYMIIQESASRAIALEMGTVVAIDTGNSADMENYKAHPEMGIDIVRRPVNAPVAYYFDCNEASPCSDVNLRKAICYALDNVAIVEACNYPADPAYGIQPRMYDAPESWTTGVNADGTERDYYNYNLALAKEYLAKSDYDGTSLNVFYMNQGAIADVVIMFQSALKEIGITVNLVPADISTLNAYMIDYTKWDVMFDIMGGGNYLSSVLKEFWTEDSAPTCNGMQVTGIVDEKLDELYVELMGVDYTRDPGRWEEVVTAWDEYFTYEQCYGYAVCCYYDQSACLSTVTPAISGSQNKLTVGAFTYSD